MASKNTSDEDSFDIESVKIIKPLAKSNFPVYLSVGRDNKAYVMKIYPYSEKGPLPQYHNEARFSFLNHPNIIKLVASEQEFSGYNNQTSSFIITEYASFGDLSKIVLNKHYKGDEKLARTLFRQLIEGLDYLHRQNVAHLDIKPDNLLLTEDMKVKISDFDRAHMKSDKDVARIGTPNYRAPEILKGYCRKPEKADIYSAGVTLFYLASGVLPYLENEKVDDQDLYKFFIEQDPKYFEIHQKCIQRKALKTKELQKLIFLMTKFDPDKRISISNIRKNEWFQGPIYDICELRRVVLQYA